MLSLSCVRAAIVCVCVLLCCCVAVLLCCCVAVLLCCCVAVLLCIFDFQKCCNSAAKKMRFRFFCYSLTYMKGGGFPSFEKRAARRN